MGGIHGRGILHLTLHILETSRNNYRRPVISEPNGKGDNEVTFINNSKRRLSLSTDGGRALVLLRMFQRIEKSPWSNSHRLERNTKILSGPKATTNLRQPRTTTTTTTRRSTHISIVRRTNTNTYTNGYMVRTTYPIYSYNTKRLLRGPPKDSRFVRWRVFVDKHYSQSGKAFEQIIIYTTRYLRYVTLLLILLGTHYRVLTQLATMVGTNFFDVRKAFQRNERETNE